MEKEGLKHYHNFCADIWQYFKKYYTLGQLNDEIADQMIREGKTLADRYEDIPRSAVIIINIQMQLEELYGQNYHS